MPMFVLRRIPTRIISTINWACSPATRLNSTEQQLDKYDATFSSGDDFTILRKEDSKSLRIAILGAPNAGKSTLINQLVNHQVCASSAKKHTTRVAYRAILHSDNTELVFVDTPGIVSNREVKKHSLDKSFAIDPQASLAKADIVGVLHDVSKVSTRDRIHPEIIPLLKSIDPQVPSLLLLNKVDKMKNKRKLLDYVNSLSGENGWPHFVDIFMLSALSGDGVQDLRDYFLDSAKTRDWDYDEDTLTDQKPEDMITRMVRANMLNALPAEIPYNLDIKMEYFNICEDGSINTFVLIECPTERIYKLVLNKLKPQLRSISQWIEQRLTKNFQRTVRLKLVVVPQRVNDK